MPDETQNTINDDGSAFGQSGGELPKDPKAGMTEQQAAEYDAETKRLDLKHGATQEGYGRVIEREMQHRAPAVGTVNTGPAE